MSQENFRSTKMFNDFYSQQLELPSDIQEGLDEIPKPELLVQGFGSEMAQLWTMPGLDNIYQQTQGVMEVLLDEVAARSLLSRFGLPPANSNIVMVEYLRLCGELDKAKESSRDAVQDLEKVVVQIKNAFTNFIKLLQLEQLQQLQNEQERDLQTMRSLDAVNVDDEPHLKTQVAQTKKLFKDKTSATKEKIEVLIAAIDQGWKNIDGMLHHKENIVHRNNTQMVMA